MILERVSHLYRKYERWVPIAFFLLGFIFDFIVLKRIDEFAVILQQALYLLVAAFLIGVEIVASLREVTPPRFLTRVWKYREAVLHFLLGTLLNSYTIFYFKSASALTSFAFIAILIGLLIVNEFLRFGKSQLQVHVAMLSLCLISYLISLAPILLGFIGFVPFLSAVALSILAFYGYARALKRTGVITPGIARSHLWFPFSAVHGVFILLYFLQLIPPVPLSVSYMGIYHDIQKKEGEYELTMTRSRWKFWQNGDQTFRARSGDSIYCFAQIYSPTRFKEELQVRWLYRAPNGRWISSDAIAMPIVGGREEGFRAVTKKSNYQPGEWRVQIETRSNQEIGRVGFTVEVDTETEPRATHSVLR